METSDAMPTMSIRTRLWLLPAAVALGLTILLAAGLVTNRRVEAAIETGLRLRADRDTVTDAWFGIQQVRSSLLEGMTENDPAKAREHFDIVRANLDFIGDTAAAPSERAGHKDRFESGFGRLKTFAGTRLASLELGERSSITQAVEGVKTASEDLNALFQEQYHAVTDQLTISDTAIREANQSLVRLAAGAGGVLLVVMVGVMILVIRSIMRPLDATVAGFARVAHGDLGYQVEEARTPEIARMTRAFNDLSTRLHGVFELIDHIGRGSDLRETMGFIISDFRRFVPVDGLVLLMATPDGDRFAVESRQGDFKEDLSSLDDPLLANAVAGRRPVLAGSGGEGPLARCLRANGFGTALLLPMTSIRDGGAVLVVASRRTEAYTAEHQQFLGSMATQVDSVLSRTLAMDALVVAAVQGLAKLAESRDPETGDHLMRMSLYSTFIAEDLGRQAQYGKIIDPGYIRSLHRFAPMHDIGKVGIADRVLLKPGRLDDEERLEMNRHPQIGGEVLRLCEQRMNELGRSVFRIGIEIAESHHEKWDGSGYPHGRQGTDIPLSARIVAVADVFDALTSRRPYKDAFSIEQALAIIDKDAGSHFDPDVVAALHRALPRVLDIYERYKHV
jgi:HD-GYP domain-containing protein (c-di-GMP phosphodiesterase class II)